MNWRTLTQDQKDALQEITNIGMGQAGAKIAEILDEFVLLSIPRVLLLSPSEIGASLSRVVGSECVSAVRQAFHSRVARGEAIVIYGESGCRDLADLMGYEHDIDHAAERELLLDMSNILVGACVGGGAELFEASIGFSAPSLLIDSAPLAELMRTSEVSWDTALLIEVSFHLETRSFACHLVMLMPDSELATLTAALDRFMENHL